MATKDSIQFSIIIPVFNNETYISRCLESVKKQNFKNFECLIINDGSTDLTAEIIERLISEDPRMTLLNKQNEGLSMARNYGILKAKGEILAFLDSDDFWETNKLEQDFSLYNSNSKTDLTFCSCKIINQFGEIKEYPIKPFQNNPLELIVGNSVISSGSGVTLKREVFEKIGLFNTNLKSFEDLEYWFRAAINGFKFSFGEMPTVYIQKDTNSMSHNYNRMLNNNLKCFQIQLKILSKAKMKSNNINKYALKRIFGIKKYTSWKNFSLSFKIGTLMIYSLIKFNLIFNFSKKEE